MGIGLKEQTGKPVVAGLSEVDQDRGQRKLNSPVSGRCGLKLRGREADAQPSVFAQP